MVKTSEYGQYILQPQATDGTQRKRHWNTCIWTSQKKKPKSNTEFVFLLPINNKWVFGLVWDIAYVKQLETNISPGIMI